MRIWGMFAMGVALVVLAASEPRAGVNDRVTPKIAAPSEAHTLSRAFADTARAIGPSVVRVEVTAANESATASGHNMKLPKLRSQPHGEESRG